MKNLLEISERNLKDSSDSGISPAIGVLLVIAVIVVLVAAGFVVMSNVMIELEVEKDVQMNVQLSGNDVVLTVFGGNDAPTLRIVTVYIDGVDGGLLSQERKAIVGSPIIYTNMAVGITGSKFVMIKGTFADNSIAVLKNTKLMFS